MLSGEHATVPIDSIYWTDRVRKPSEEAILEKVNSISRIGLIHALVIERDGRGVAGCTRWNAMRRLGWTQVPIQWADELDAKAHRKIELEENIKRTDLTWQEECAAVRAIHQLNLEDDPTWTQAQTAEDIGMSDAYVTKRLDVAEELIKQNPRVVDAKEFSVAHGITQRQKERRKADELSQINISFPGTPDGGDQGEDVYIPAPIITTSFLDWIETYRGAPFNLLHCDFPYGIGADKFNQGAADAFGGYEDSPETYFALLSSLCDNREKLLGTSGHIIFWFSMRYYQATLDALQSCFWVDPYPLVWHKSDNKGTLPDPQRGPRRIYEVAFFCSLGDRKIIQPVSNVFSGPTQRTGEHMSEKSEDMLKHFMRMCVDENTRLLDPTAGSGSALRAGRALGAQSVLGLEMNPEFAENARRAWDATQV